MAAWFAAPLLGMLPDIARSVSNIFGAPDDTSTGTFQANVQASPSYRIPKDELIYAFKDSPNRVDYLSPYNIDNGTIDRGAWKGLIVSPSPITVQWFKGAGESYIDRSNFYSPTFTAGNSISNQVDKYKSNDSNKNSFSPLWFVAVPFVLLAGYMGYKRFNKRTK